MLERPFAAHQLAVPVQDRLRFEKEEFAHLRPGQACDLLELNEQNCQETLLPAAGPGALPQPPLKHSQLLAKYEDFQVDQPKSTDTTATPQKFHKVQIQEDDDVEPIKKIDAEALAKKTQADAEYKKFQQKLED